MRTPGARPVVGLVSGPLGWGARQVSDQGRGLPIEPVEAIDVASDLAADRIRALAGCGVQRIAVVELGASSLYVDAELAAEFHEAMIRAAHHLRVDLLLVAPDPIAGVASPAELGYEHWASPDCCSERSRVPAFKCLCLDLRPWPAASPAKGSGWPRRTQSSPPLSVPTPTPAW